MRGAALLLLLLAAAATSDVINTTTVLSNDTIILGEHAVFIANDTIVDGNKTIFIGNDTIIETDGEHAPIVRKKRTFGDIVFRGLADVLGYDVQRKSAPAAFPPPLDPVPGIDTPLQAAPAPPPPCAPPRPAAPPPCRPPRPKPPPPPPPCPKPPPPPPPPCSKPPPPPPPPCSKPPPPPPCPPPPPPPCPPPPPPPPPPCPKPKKPRPPPPPPPPPCPKPPGNPCGAKDETGAELITSNLQLSFNINRNRPTQAPDAEYVEEFEPIAIEPRAARLPAKQERKPQVFVDAFVVRNGAKQKVDTADVDVYNDQQAALDDDYIDYDEEPPQQDRQIVEDDYEDLQESRDKAQQKFGKVVNQFWNKNKNINNPKKLPKNHYKNVHFGDRDLASQLRRRSDSSESHQSLQRERSKSNRIPLPFSRDTDEEYEETTTTEDPHRQLRPRVLPPTEHNPNQIDTVTVRVPPIYKEKRPKKLHRGPDRDEEDNQEAPYYYNNSNEDDSDSDGENSAVSVQREPTRNRRRKKARRKTRSTREKYPDSEKKEKLKEYDPYSELDYDYYGKKLPISDEEKSYRRYEIPEPAKDADLARIEERPFLDDHERLVEDPERIGEEERLDDSGHMDDSGHSDESGRTDDLGRTDDKEKLVEDKERSYEDAERTDEKQRADSSERTDKLSPQAEIRETGYSNNYLKKTKIRVEDPRPLPLRNTKKKKA